MLAPTDVPTTPLGALRIDDEYLRVAVSLAYDAGDIHRDIVSKYGSGGMDASQKKRPADVVTEADTTAEAHIRNRLQDTYPQHEILGEEDGLVAEGDSRHRWIIDPLDGTTNFFHGALDSCVIIGHAIDGELHAGVVYDFNTDDVYYAVNGEGAYQNAVDEPLSVSGTESMESALFGVDYSGRNVGDEHFEEFYAQLERETHGTRQLVCGGLNGVRVARGRFDALFERRTHPWDISAPTLLVREAGGRVTDLQGSEDWDDVRDGNCLISNGNIHDKVLNAYQSLSD